MRYFYPKLGLAVAAFYTHLEILGQFFGIAGRGLVNRGLIFLIDVILFPVCG